MFVRQLHNVVIRSIEGSFIISQLPSETYKTFKHGNMRHSWPVMKTKSHVLVGSFIVSQLPTISTTKLSKATCGTHGHTINGRLKNKTGASTLEL